MVENRLEVGSVLCELGDKRSRIRRRDVERKDMAPSGEIWMCGVLSEATGMVGVHRHTCTLERHNLCQVEGGQSFHSYQYMFSTASCAPILGRDPQEAPPSPTHSKSESNLSKPFLLTYTHCQYTQVPHKNGGPTSQPGRSSFNLQALLLCIFVTIPHGSGTAISVTPSPS